MDPCPISHRYLHRVVRGFVEHQPTKFKCIYCYVVARSPSLDSFQKKYKSHRDISMNNILVDENDEGVLIDLRARY